MTATESSTSVDWTGERAERWVRSGDGLARQLAPVADLLFEAAALQPGERVLDVGCGTGPTTRLAAAAVGPAGTVCGVDVAPAMLAAARETPDVAGSAPITWIEAEAQSWEGSGTAFDVVLSRFGVMFFSDPAAAFANLFSLTAPGGRLHLVVWAPRSRSALFEVPLSVALGLCRRWGLTPEVPPADGGPFSFGDVEALGELLAAAGWHDLAIEARTVALPVGGGLGAAEAARASLEFGPTRTVTDALDDAQREAVIDGIAEAYRDHLDGAGHVVLDAVPLFVAARRPA